MIPIQYTNHNQTTHLHEQNGVVYMTFRQLDRMGVPHAFSTRLGGVSQGYLSTMNLSFHRGDDPEAVLENHRRLAKAVGYDVNRLVLSDQIHETHIYQVTEADCGKGVFRESDILGVDGLVTDHAGIPLMIFAADCVPLFFYDPIRRVVALAHSGWRGTAARMGSAMLNVMEREYGSRPADVYCTVGPSICGNCYTVGEEVAEIFRTEFRRGSEWKNFLYPVGNGTYRLDLWEANRYILLEAGAAKEHVEVTDVCTCCNPELLYSHRASHGMRGNLGAVICLPDERHCNKGKSYEQ